MVFPAIEAKFSIINRLPGEAIITIRLYRIDDGGVIGNVQTIIRTLWVSRTYTLDRRITKAQLVAYVKDRLQEEAESRGYHLTADRFICSL